jgi:hypothetical protein
VCVRLAALRARVCFRCVAVGGRCCVARVLWVAAAAAGSPCYALLVRLVSCAVSHCCSVRADSGDDAQEFEKRLWCCLMTRRAARAFSSRLRLPRTLCLRCGVCVDARDARGCVSTLRLGCQASSYCCSACASVAAFTRCLQLLCCCFCCCCCCCCCVPSACLHRAWCRCGRVVTCASVATSLACVVG